MKTQSLFYKIIFNILAILFFTAYTTTVLPGGFSQINIFIGISLGFLFSIALFFVDSFCKQISLKTLNTTSLGLFFGYILGQSINLVFSGALEVASINLWPEILSLTQAGIFLFSTYLGVTFTARSAEEIHINLPFFRFKETQLKKKDIILDMSILTDTRLIDLATSGLLNNLAVIPKFILKEIYEGVESTDETLRSKSRRAFDVTKKLEALPNLEVRYSDIDFPEVKELSNRAMRLARITDSNILTADMSQIEQSALDGIQVINIHSLSKALKPITHSGEMIEIKVQRYGKEARQGVGYLEDGTMVVINGGAEYIGETIPAQVLSVKHTSSGRMIFCNAMDETGTQSEYLEESIAQAQQCQSDYLSL